VLDVGAGIGVVHHELLDAGAERAIHVDATAANIRTAEGESQRRGHGGRVTFRQGDFVALAPEIPTTDIVTLDRVICCYPDMEQLVSASAAHARRFYGAVFPRERVIVKTWIALSNWLRGLRGNAFRAYIHPVAAIDAALTSRGFVRRSLRETLVWRVVVYARNAIADGHD
jgi:magnesium-protoporphyrin O-methyltransferase